MYYYFLESGTQGPDNFNFSLCAVLDMDMMTATYVPLRDSLDTMGLGAVFMLCAVTHTVTNCPEQTPHTTPHQTATYQITAHRATSQTTPHYITPHYTILHHFPSQHFTLITSLILVYGMTLHQLSKI